MSDSGTVGFSLRIRWIVLRASFQPARISGTCWRGPLQRLFVVYPGEKDYALDDRIRVLALRNVGSVEGLSRMRSTGILQQPARISPAPMDGLELPGDAGEVTQLLRAWRDGDAAASGQVFSLVYERLRQLARGQLRRRGPDHSLGTTGLVHEAYLKLVGHERLETRDRGHFFALAAKAMRQILVDRSRRRAAGKRADPARRQPFEESAIPVDARADELLALDEALAHLEQADARLARLVELRCFAGFTLEAAAELLGVSPRTAKRDWQKARAYLSHELLR